MNFSQSTSEFKINLTKPMINCSQTLYTMRLCEGIKLRRTTTNREGYSEALNPEDCEEQITIIKGYHERRTGRRTVQIRY
jgi:hypothetical protein